MISIARNEFGIERFEDIEIIESDAYTYLVDSRDKFDLIIVDIFIVDRIPPLFTDEKFLKSLCTHLSKSGKILYNTMRRSLRREILEEMIALFREEGLHVKLIEKII